MPLGFPISGHRHELWGGRPRPRATPRSRISVGKRWISGTKSGTGASRADLGVRPTRTAAPPSFRNYAALGLEAQCRIVFGCSIQAGALSGRAET